MTATLLRPDQPTPTQAGARFLCAFHGASMIPTLREGELLEVEAYGDRPILVGDIALLRVADSARLVVHRVVTVDAWGLRSQGDNATGRDPWLLRRGDVLGRVVVAQGPAGERPVARGLRGRLLTRRIRAVRALKMGAAQRLSPRLLALARHLYRTIWSGLERT